MPSWPVQGDNAGTWGTDLNSCLLVSHNSDGTFLIGGSGAAAGRILLSQASGTGGAQSDSNFTWTGGTGVTALNVGANTGQATEILFYNGGTIEWYFYNQVSSSNTYRISNATRDVLVLAQGSGSVLTLPTYGAGFLQTSSTGAVTAGPSLGANSGIVTLGSDTTLTAGTPITVLDSGALVAGTYLAGGQMVYLKGASTSHMELFLSHNGGVSFDCAVDENGIPGGDWGSLTVAALMTLTASQHIIMIGISISAASTAKALTSGGNPPATTLSWAQLA